MKHALLVGFLFLAAVAACHSAAPERGMTIPLGTHRLEHQWELGDHREDLMIDLKQSARIWSADQRTWVAISFHHPNLTSKLHESLRSKAVNGYTTIARSGSTEAKLRRVTGISLSLDHNRSVWLHAIAEVQMSGAQILRSTRNRSIAAEFTARVSNGTLTLAPKSLNIAGVGREINRIITNSLDTAVVALPNCLTSQDLLLEDLRFIEADNRLTITVSLTGSLTSVILTCLRES